MSYLSIEQAFEIAVRHHQDGQLTQAESLYRQILAKQQQHAGALHYLGKIACQVGRNEVAVNLIRQAIALQPGYAEAHSNLGHALTALGQLDEAFAAYREAIALKPDYAEGYSDLGNILAQRGELDGAISAYQRAIDLKPQFSEAYSNLSNPLREKGQIDDAIAACHQALDLNPKIPETHNNLGNALTEIGQWDQAIASFRQALSLRPQFPEAYNNLGKALVAKGQLDEAVACYRQAIALKPGYHRAYKNLGNVLRKKGLQDDALDAYRKAIALKPDYPDAYLDLGNGLLGMGHQNDAVAAYRQALFLKPNYHEAHGNVVYALHFDPICDADFIAEEHRRWNRQYGEPLKKYIQPHVNDRNPERRLRIGYVSPDFIYHSVAKFLLPLLTHHDKNRVEVFAYAQVPVPDDMTQRLRSYTHGWHSIVGLSDFQAVDLIRQDRIDILVDLAGHTAGNRLTLMAHKPAPVQATYLGYPDTTGLTSIDYRITDALADPPGQTEQFHSEQLARLPDGMWCYDPAETGLPVNGLPAMSSGHITFGCLNNFSKVNEKMLRLWATILREVTPSRLILRPPEGSAQEWALRILQSEQITPDRIDFRPKSTHNEYLHLYHETDIALDPFPYHGTATTCDALWMGVPVITLGGHTHVSRVGVSLLNRVGLPELVAETADQYVQIAATLAADLPRLRELRRGLRQRMRQSPLMDGPRFARNIEAAYRQMWRRWCKTHSAVL